MLRHDGSRVSARAILRNLFDREPSALLGADIMRELKEQAERHAGALGDLCLGIEATRLTEDEETREILQEEARQTREKVQQIREDLERMVTNFATENSRLDNENPRHIKKDFQKQKADAEHGGQFFDQEHKARKLAEAGRRRAKAQLATEREAREREKRKRERQEHERHERERRERETQKKERQDRERKERGEKERKLWHEVLECAKKEL